MPKLSKSGNTASSSGFYRIKYPESDEDVDLELEETKRLVAIGYHKFCRRRGIDPTLDGEWSGERNYQRYLGRKGATIEQPN